MAVAREVYKTPSVGEPPTEKPHVYWGINYRITDLPDIRTWYVTWYVIKTIESAFDSWYDGPMFLTMLTCVLLESAECNGIHWLEVLYCQVCVSYE